MKRTSWTIKAVMAALVMALIALSQPATAGAAADQAKVAAAAATIDSVLQGVAPLAGGVVDQSGTMTFDYDALRKLASDPAFAKSLNGTPEEQKQQFADFTGALDSLQSMADSMIKSGQAPAKPKDGSFSGVEVAAPGSSIKVPPVDDSRSLPPDPTGDAERDAKAQADAAGRAVGGAPSVDEQAATDKIPTTDPSNAPDVAKPAATGVLAEFQAKQGWKELQAAMTANQSTPTRTGVVARPNGTESTCKASPFGYDYPVSAISAPVTNTVRPGTITFPAQDEFISTTAPRIVYGPTAGGFQTRIGAGGVEQFHVIAHLSEQSLGFWFDAYRPQFHVVDGDGAVYDFIPGSPGTDISVQCYAEDTGAVGVQRALVDAWLPFHVGAMNLVDPGFQVRVESVDNHFLGNPGAVFFLGGDQRTTHIGAAPVGSHSTVNEALAVGADDGFMVDRNNDPTDDLASKFIPVAQQKVRDTVTALEGTDLHITHGVDLRFHVNDTALDQVNLTADLRPTWKDSTGQIDDEHRIRVDAHIGGAKVEGSFRWHIRIRVLWWYITIDIPFCYAKVRFNADTQIYGALDIDPANPAGLKAEIETMGTNIDVYNKVFLGGPWCLLANFVPNAVANDVAGRAIDKAGTLNIDLATAVANLNQSLSAGVTLPTSNGVRGYVTGFDRTCVPLGCDGHKAGDVLMWENGLEAGVNAVITDRKPWSFFSPASRRRRFPLTFAPTLTRTATQIVHDHWNPPYDVAAAISPTTINQAFRSLTEGGPAANSGLLDVTTPDLSIRPAIAPIYHSGKNAKRTVSVTIPDLRMTSPDGTNSWAINVYAGADVQFDLATGTLQPQLVTVNPITRLDVAPIKCSNTFYLVCVGVPALASTLVNVLSDIVLPQLFANGLGTIKIPQVAGFDLLNVQVSKVDKHLVTYIDVGAPRVWVNGGTGPTGFDFDALSELPGSGPVATTWVVHDDIGNTLAPNQTSPGIIGPTSHDHVNRADVQAIIIPFPWPWGPNRRIEVRKVTATVTATRLGVTRSASLTNYLVEVI